MPRTITIDAVDNLGDVTFTVTGAKVAKMNQQYKVAGIPTDSKDSVMQGIRDYLEAFKRGLQAEKKADVDASITALIGKPQNDTEA